MVLARKKYNASLLLALDLAVALLALPAAYHLRMRMVAIGDFVQDFISPSLYSPETYTWFYLVTLPIIAIFAFFDSRRMPPYRLSDYPRQMVLVIEQASLSACCIGFYAYISHQEISRSLVLLYLSLLGLTMLLTRLVFVLFSRSRQGSEFSCRRVLAVGNSPDLPRIAQELERQDDPRYVVVGYVTSLSPDILPPGAPHLGGAEDLPTLLEENVVDEVLFVSSDKKDLAWFERVALQCEEVGVATRLSLDFFPHTISQTFLDFVGNQPFLTFSPVPEQPLALAVKRLMDIAGAMVGLVFTALVFLFVAPLVRLTSPGPIIYRQTRCGLFGRRFTIFKFRSMVEGADDILWELRDQNEMSGPVFKMRDDPRITPLGRFLRKSSLDEFPQFFNVLRGDMSLVGPRAPLPEEVQAYARWQRRRLSVKPGITCLWQISGRNDIDFNEWMKLDLRYIDNWSLWLDIKILLRTLPTVLLGRGAR